MNYYRHLSPYTYAIVFSLLLCVLQCFQQNLLFQRELIATGQVWRLWTGNFVHTNFPHLALNLVGLWLVLLINRPTLSSRQFVSYTVFLCTCIGLGLWFLNPDLGWYAGFSGVLYGLFTLAGIQAARHTDWTGALLILVGVCGKTWWDWLSGGNSTSAQWINAPVIYVAHVYGIAGGAFLAAIPPRTKMPI